MPKSPEPTTINSVLEDYDRTFPINWPLGLGSDRQADRVAFKAFLRSAILKTCDEILGSIEVKEPTYAPDGVIPVPTEKVASAVNMGWNSCRATIESKVKEIKNS